MKYTLLLAVLFLTATGVSGQSKKTNPINAGMEIDILPYATGGWFAAAWTGKEHWRLRALAASVNKPDFTTRKGFTNHHIKAYAILVDRFFNPGWKGVWIGGGLVLWNNRIQSDAKVQTATFTNYLLNGSAGYNIKINKHIYLSPWAGISLRTAGDTNVPVDNKLYTLPFINPEASLKLGIWL